MSDETWQLPLFGDQPEPYVPDDELSSSDQLPLNLHTSINHAVEIYIDSLERIGTSIHTVKAFKSDMGLLARWIGEARSVGDISTQDLNRFLHWMLHDRDKPCSPKTYARRVTTLKHFFSWLFELGIVKTDPAAAIVQKSVTSAPPEVLTDDEVGKVLALTEAMRQSESPDARPHFLVMLLLQTGMKKAEVMALTRDDFVHVGPNTMPEVWIRYDKPRMRYKERRIVIDPEIMPLLREYLAQRQPAAGMIFDCTPRNLEYVLRDVADGAGVDRRKVSFESLRWTAALWSFRQGMPPEALRTKLGLSRISWRETSKKLAQLAADLEKIGH